MSLATGVLACLAAWIPSTGRAAEEASPQITKINQYWGLTDAQRARTVPFTLACDVTYYDPVWKILFVQDGAGSAAYVPNSETLNFPFSWGQRLAVTGQIVPPSSDIQFDHAVIRAVGQSKPVPVNVTAQQIFTGSFVDQFVSVEGLVDHYQVKDATHVGADLATGGRGVVLWMIRTPGADLPDLTDSIVRVEGVDNGKYGPDGKLSSLELMVQGPEHLSVVGKLASDVRFRAPVTPIASLPAGSNTFSHVSGTVVAQNVGTSLTLRDDTGQVELESGQTRPCRVGERVEAVGIPVNLGTRIRLSGGLYRTISGRSAATAGAVTDHTLRLAAQVLELSPEEAAKGRSVDLTGVVTWNGGSRDPIIFVQDSTGGMRVLGVTLGRRVLRGGRKVEVKGVTAMGPFSPQVVASECLPLSDLVLPVADTVTLQQAQTGADENHWVEMEGYLRRSRMDAGRRILEMVTPQGDFEAVLSSAQDVSSLEGAVVRVQGVCTADADAQGRITGTRLWTPSTDQIVVEEPPQADPFDRPLLSLAALGRYNPFQTSSRLLRFSGVVLRQSVGRMIQMEAGGQSLRVFSAQKDPLRPGDKIDAVGFLTSQGGRYSLREAAYRKTGEDRVPAPVTVREEDRASSANDGQLVTLEASIIGLAQNQEQFWINCRRGQSLFTAVIDKSVTDGEGPLFAPGNVVSLTGVYELITDELGRPARFRINLRSTADIVVLKSPPWLTVGRVTGFASALTVAILLFTAWVAVLRKQVREKTDQIREQVKNEARLQAELQRASKLESIGLLAGGIAHDFNNLLTAVIGNLSLARYGTKMDPEAEESLKEAEKAAARARDLTRQLLTFAKGGAPIQAAVHLSDVVREVAEFALRGANVLCQFDIPQGLWPANVDKGQIGQVVQNIAINALQAMPGGGVLSVSMRNETIEGGNGDVLSPGRYVKLSFSDQGVGIKPEDLEKIFDPYFTTKKGGSGLGLATVHSIVKKHLGHVSVESTAGRGTTFHVWLPAAEVEPDGAPASPASALPRQWAGAARILFMDDEEPIRQVGSAILRRAGFQVCAVSDGAEAIREYTEGQKSGRPYSAVVLDLTIPGGMGGSQALERLLRLDPNVKAIVSSGYSNDTVLSNYRSHGFQGRVTKPYETEDLLVEVSRVLAPQAS
jgi:signal transduction histidine kinase/ActR/RegA family two-component response regulator